MHPVPKASSGLSSLFSGTLVLLGIFLGALLVFLAIAVSAFWSDPLLRLLHALGAGAGFVAAFGGAFLGKEFSMEQKRGLYIVAAGFIIALAL
jgi:hypothetical protein